MNILSDEGDNKKLKLDVMRQLKKEWLLQLIKENGPEWVRENRKLLAAQWEYIKSMM